MSKPLKILCASAIDPYSEDHTRYKPLWPACLSAYLKLHLGSGKAEISYFSGDLQRDIREREPDILALSSITQNYGIAVRMAHTAKAAGLPVVIGGMHITSLPGSMSPDIDIACMGEGEETFRQLVECYLDRGSFPLARLTGIHGLAYRYDGGVHLTPERELIGSLDELPHPDRSIIGYGSRRDYIYTSRGCPYRCIFCASNAHWRRVRYSSPAYVLDEIQELADHGVKTIRFNDDNFPANAKRMAEISRLVTEAGLYRKVRFSFWARANDITEGTVAALKAMNIVSVVMGLETANDRVLEELKGNASVALNRKAIDLLRDAGIQTNADFIIGSPDETEQEMMDTYRFIRKSRLSFVTVNVFSPLPGTPVWKLAESRGLVSDTMDFSRCTFKFGPDAGSAVMVSERLSHHRLWELYQKFRRLALFRNILAIPRSPWLWELPGLALRKVSGKIRKTARRLRREG